MPMDLEKMYPGPKIHLEISAKAAAEKFHSHGKKMYVFALQSFIDGESTDRYCGVLVFGNEAMANWINLAADHELPGLAQALMSAGRSAIVSTVFGMELEEMEHSDSYMRVAVNHVEKKD